MPFRAVSPPRGEGACVRKRAALWAVAGLLALHNLEEALTVPRYLPAVRARFPAAHVAAELAPEEVLVALAVVTVVPLAVVAWAVARPRSRAALWGALVLQATVLLNVVPHVAGAVALRGYAPGVATALAINLPFSVYLLRRAARERWLGRRALLALVPGALVVHGPLLVGLVLLAARLRRG